MVADRLLIAEALAGHLWTTFRAEGVDMLVIKGPVLARWLYEDGEERPFNDLDVVVSPAQLHRAERALRGLGYVNNYDGRSPDFREAHADGWLHERLLTIDLHRRLWGVTADPEAAWATLWCDAGAQTMGGQRVPVPGRAAQLVLIALHAAHHGDAAPNPVIDLAHAVERLAEDEWSAATELAAKIDATPAFVAGLHLLPEGGGLARRLGLPEPEEVPWQPQRYEHDLPPTAEGFLRLAEAPDWRAKRSLLVREAFPSAGFMRLTSGRPRLARLGHGGLAAAYVLRWADLVRSAPSGYRHARDLRAGLVRR